MLTENQYNSSAFADAVDCWALLNAWAQRHYTEAAGISRARFDKQISLLKSMDFSPPKQFAALAQTDISNHWITKQLLLTLERQRSQLTERAQVLSGMLNSCAEHAQTNMASYHYKKMYLYSGELCRFAVQVSALEADLAVQLVAMGAEEAVDYLPERNPTLH